MSKQFVSQALYTIKNTILESMLWGLEWKRRHPDQISLEFLTQRGEHYYLTISIEGFTEYGGPWLKATLVEGSEAADYVNEVAEAVLK